MASRRVASTLRILAITAYVASLLFPPYIPRDPAMEEWGFTILILGWVSMFSLMTAWFANPLVLYGTVVALGAGSYLWLSALALTFAASIAFVRERQRVGAEVER